MPRPNHSAAETDAEADARAAAALLEEPLDEGSAEPVDAKPRLRGWIHTVMAPVALVVGLILVIGSDTTVAIVSTAVFGTATVLLFGTSAVYHRGRWSPGVAGVLRRLDHSNIFLVIAGTYTPLATLLLPEDTARLLLWLVWGGAVAGLLARVFWLSAPRWLYVPIYLALGWVAVGFLPAFWDAGGPAVVLLVIIGGLGYTLGAVAYGFKRPNPVPGWFGFHEIFHTGTVIGYGCHAAAIALAALAL